MNETTANRIGMQQQQLGLECNNNKQNRSTATANGIGMQQQQIEEECNNKSLNRNATTTNRIGIQQQTAGIRMQLQQREQE